MNEENGRGLESGSRGLQKSSIVQDLHDDPAIKMKMIFICVCLPTYCVPNHLSPSRICVEGRVGSVGAFAAARRFCARRGL